MKMNTVIQVMDWRERCFIHAFMAFLSVALWFRNKDRNLPSFEDHRYGGAFRAYRSRVTPIAAEFPGNVSKADRKEVKALEKHQRSRFYGLRREIF
jgi:hypothetical protein